MKTNNAELIRPTGLADISIQAQKRDTVPLKTAWGSVAKLMRSVSWGCFIRWSSGG